MTDLELLRVQADGSFDENGRIGRCDGFVVAASGGAAELWVGDGVADDVAARLREAFVAASPAGAVEACRRVLGDDVPVAAGPSFVVEQVARVEIDRPVVVAGRHANPGGWRDVEWEELLDGRLGPWAFVVDGGRVVAIAHTPRAMTARAAECGVWTDPAHRGRGYAAAAVAAWAELVRPSGRSMFYSTDEANRSSQRVAERLGLRCIGWTWRVGERRRDDVHQLSSLAR